MAKFLPSAKISAVHGQPRRVGAYVVIPMYHPAAALHAGNLRKVIEDDFRKIPAALEKTRLAVASVTLAEPATEQMRLF